MIPVTALHGAGGSPQDWAAVADELGTSHELIALELRGPWQWEAVLDRLEMEIADRGLDNPPVIGMSPGGMVAAMWGRRHPECPAVVDLDGHGTPTQLFRYLDEDRVAVTGDVTRLRAAFAAYGQPELQTAMEELDCFEVFHDVRCPLLLVTATKPFPGQELFAAYQRGLDRDLGLLAETRPDTEVVRINASHAMAFEDPSGVAALIKGFLAAR